RCARLGGPAAGGPGRGCRAGAAATAGHASRQGPAVHAGRRGRGRLAPYQHPPGTSHPNVLARKQRTRGNRAGGRMRALAIDQGTTSTRALVVDEAGVTTVLSVEHRQLYPAPDHVEHDPEELIANLTACLEAAPEVDCV